MASGRTTIILVVLAIVVALVINGIVLTRIIPKF